MKERAKAALHHCAEIPLVQANATALLNLLEGDPLSSVLMTHPSKVYQVPELLFKSLLLVLRASVFSLTAAWLFCCIWKLGVELRASGRMPQREGQYSCPI